MTVYQNIVYGLNSRGVAKEEVTKRVSQAVEQLNITQFLDRMPDTLSGGEQQRAALARALVVTPDLLLLDEPLSAVDTRLRRRLQRELKRVQEKTGTTFIHVTHDVSEALLLGHRVGVMLDGRLHQIGKPADLFRKPTDSAVATFLGMRNIFAAQNCTDGFCEADGVKIHVGEREDAYRHVWIRPEEILLSKDVFESSARNQFWGTVEGWDFQDVFINIRLIVQGLKLNVLVTYASFDTLELEPGLELCVTFKSSAVYCF
jgi:molybdate/tungstate transport system ATP-binding protein